MAPRGVEKILALAVPGLFRFNWKAADLFFGFPLPATQVSAAVAGHRTPAVPQVVHVAPPPMSTSWPGTSSLRPS